MVRDILDLVGEHVRRGHLHRGRQVDDHLVLGRRLDHVDHRIAHLNRVVRFGAGERFGAVLVVQLGLAGLALQLLAQLGRVGGELLDAFLVLAEHHLALQHGHRVVEVHHRALGAAQAFVGLADQVLARLGEHHDRHVVGDELTLDEQSDEVVIGFGGRGEAHLDLLEAHRDQHVPEAQLTLRIHRVDQRLIAVAQIHRAPARRALQTLARPRALRIVERHLLVIRHVLVVRHLARLLGFADETRRRQQRVVVPSVGCGGHRRKIEYR